MSFASAATTNRRASSLLRSFTLVSGLLAAPMAAGEQIAANNVSLDPKTHEKEIVTAAIEQIGGQLTSASLPTFLYKYNDKKHMIRNKAQTDFVSTDETMAVRCVLLEINNPDRDTIARLGICVADENDIKKYPETWKNLKQQILEKMKNYRIKTDGTVFSILRPSPSNPDCVDISTESTMTGKSYQDQSCKTTMKKILQTPIGYTL